MECIARKEDRLVATLPLNMMPDTRTYTPDAQNFPLLRNPYGARFDITDRAIAASSGREMGLAEQKLMRMFESAGSICAECQHAQVKIGRERNTVKRAIAVTLQATCLAPRRGLCAPYVEFDGPPVWVDDALPAVQSCDLPDESPHWGEW